MVTGQIDTCIIVYKCVAIQRVYLKSFLLIIPNHFYLSLVVFTHQVAEIFKRMMNDMVSGRFDRLKTAIK